MRNHHDIINPDDFPREWLTFPPKFTVGVEAKFKEIALLKLK